MNSEIVMDVIDRHILRLLVEDARRTIRDIADIVGLSVAPVGRRIRRMESLGVIAGYTTRINPHKANTEIEALVEVKLVGDAPLHLIAEAFGHSARVQEVLTIAGGADAVVRLRADSIASLNDIIGTVRGRHIVSTRTLIVLNSWSPVAQTQLAAM